MSENKISIHCLSTYHLKMATFGTLSDMHVAAQSASEEVFHLRENMSDQMFYPFIRKPLEKAVAI